MINYEKFHLSTENRKNGDYIKVLHPDFKEFGQSGRIFTLSDFKCSALDSSDYEIQSFKVLELSAANRLCTYTLVNHTNKMTSRRSSVWVLYEDDWKLIFHQGTKVHID